MARKQGKVGAKIKRANSAIPGYKMSRATGAYTPKHGPDNTPSYDCPRRGCHRSFKTARGRLEHMRERHASRGAHN